MKRTVEGVTNLLFDQLEENEKQEISFSNKVKNTDAIVKNIWRMGTLNMQHKRMMMRAPEIAKDKSIVLELTTDK